MDYTKKRQLFDEALAKGLIEEVTFTGAKMSATDVSTSDCCGPLINSDKLAVLESRALTRHLTFSNPDPSQDHVISKSAYVRFLNRCNKYREYKVFGLF